MDTRTAAYSDAEAIIGFDHVAQSERSRVNFIHRAIASRSCFVGLVDGRVVGYGVLEYTFFENGFISMLYVHSKFRRRGVGSALVRHMEQACKTEKLFTSTNRSNTRMLALLKKLKYRSSGTIKNLHETDPELVYFKRLQRQAT